MSKSKVKVDAEWSRICDSFVDAQFALADAVSAFELFNSKAPDKGGQRAYNKWRDANNDEFYALERATIDAARDYVIANLAQEQYFERNS